MTFALVNLIEYSLRVSLCAVCCAADSDDDLMKGTGDYLAPSVDLPSDIIDIKKCTNANKENPGKASLTLFQWCTIQGHWRFVGLNYCKVYRRKDPRSIITQTQGLSGYT